MSGRSRLSWALAAALASVALPATSAAADGARIAALQSPATVLVGAPFEVGVDLAAPADATTLQVTRADTGAVIASIPVATGAQHVTARIRLDNAGRIPLRFGDATATVEATDFQVDPTSVIQSSLAGYGAQFNHSLFYPRLNPLVPADGATLKQKVNTLGPRLARVFFPAQALTDWVRLASFQQVVRMAQDSGATILVTWSGGYSSIDANMSRFAATLADLVRTGANNLRWVSLLNEPNGNWTPAVPKETYERMYRALDAELRQDGIRDQVRLMGGGLLQNGQRAWLDYMVDHMSDVLDAYSVHIYWDVWDTAKLESRLAEVKAIDLRSGAKPVYVTEFGVRGLRDAFGLSVSQPGLWLDGETPMAQTNVNALQLAWFNVLASRLGYPGTITWDAFNAKYDSGTQDFSCIGPAPGFELRPCYYLLRLFTATTEPGWRVLGVPGDSGGKLLTAYSGPAGQLTIVGLDRGGALLNAMLGDPVTYTVGGLPPMTTFHLVLWNVDGAGKLTNGPLVTTDALGVATLIAPQTAVWALTTHE
jgi:hypothetical protein